MSLTWVIPNSEASQSRNDYGPDRRACGGSVAHACSECAGHAAESEAEIGRSAAPVQFDGLPSGAAGGARARQGVRAVRTRALRIGGVVFSRRASSRRVELARPFRPRREEILRVDAREHSG